MADQGIVESSEFNGLGTYQDKRNGLGARILDAWKDMRGSTRRLIEENPSEHRLLFYVLFSDLIFFLSWSLKTVVAPVSGAEKMIPLEIGLWLIAALFLRTFIMYVFSAVVTISARMFGGTGSWKAVRTGVFWGALVAAPFGFLMALLTVMMSWFEGTFPILREEWVALPPYWISLVPFIWFISQGIAESNGFKRNSISFMVMSVVALGGLLGAMFLRANGII